MTVTFHDSILAGTRRILGLSWLPALVFILGSTACNEQPCPKASPHQATKSAPKATEEHNAALEPMPLSNYFASVPAGASFAGMIDLVFLKRKLATFLDGLTGRGGLKPDDLLQEIDDLCKKKLGITCTNAKWAGLWLTADGKKLVFTISGLKGRLHPPGQNTTSGTSSRTVLTSKLQAVQKGGLLYIGNQAGLDSLSKASPKSQKGFQSKEIRAVLAAIDTEKRRPILCILGDTRRMAPKDRGKLPKALVGFGISAQGHITTALSGDKAALAGFKATWEVATQLLLAQLDVKKDQAVASGPLADALVLTAGSRLLKALKANIVSSMQGDLLVIKTKRPITTGSLAGLGLAASVAIPAFIKYIKRAKAARHRFYESQKGHRNETARPSPRKGKAGHTRAR